MTKQEAAERLGVSVRALERYTQQKRISVRYEKGRTKPVPHYDEASVQAFREELSRPTHQPAPLPPETDRALVPSGSKGIAVREDLLQQFTESLAGRMESLAVRIAEKPILKLSEVRRLTGIPEHRLKKAIEAGKLKAMRNGEWGRGYRMRRSDLDAYIAGD